MAQQQEEEMLNEALIAAVYSGNIEECQRLVQAGANVNSTNHDGVQGLTPLHWAAWKGHVEVCQLLIDRLANVNATDDGDRTPLHLAASRGHVDVCRLLVVEGANVNTTDHYGSTPLHDAAFHGSADVCRVLVDRGADIHATAYNDDRTPLDLAIISNATVVLAYFYMHRVVDFHAPDHTGRRPWDRLTDDQQKALTKAMEDHNKKIAMLQSKGLPNELARLVMGYL